MAEINNVLLFLLLLLSGGKVQVGVSAGTHCRLRRVRVRASRRCPEILKYFEMAAFVSIVPTH